jgi:hypothetical protein
MVSFRPLPQYTRGKAPGTHWIGDWVSPKAGLDATKRREISYLCQESNPESSAVQLV